MHFFLFNFFSTLENVAAIVLLLAIFKYRVKDYVAQILLTSLIMSLISYTMNYDLNYSSWVPLVTIITIFLFIWITFRVAFLYALIISVVGYVAYGLVQLTLIFSLQTLGIITFEAARQPFSMLGYLIQFSSSILACFFAYLLKRKNYGFNWIPYSHSAKFILKGENITLLVSVIISLFVLGLVFHLFLTGYIQLLSITILFFIVLACLVYLAGKQEVKYYD